MVIQTCYLGGQILSLLLVYHLMVGRVLSTRGVSITQNSKLLLQKMDVASGEQEGPVPMLKQYYRWGLLAKQYYRWGLLAKHYYRWGLLAKQYYRLGLLAKQYYRWSLPANILKQYYRWGLLANMLKRYYRWGFLLTF